MKYLLLSCSMFLAIVGQFLLKKGVVSADLAPTIKSVSKTIFSPLVLAGFISYGISSIIWLFVLQKFPLSIAYPALSLTYVAIVILSILIFKEPFTIYKSAGIIFIILGVYLLFK